MPNVVKIPREQTAGQPAYDGEISPFMLEQIIGGLLIPNQSAAKALAREVKKLRSELQKVKAVLAEVNEINKAEAQRG